MTDEQYPYQDELNARRLRYEADDRESDITRDKPLSKLRGIAKGREWKEMTELDNHNIYQDKLNARRLQYEADGLRQQLADQRKALEALWKVACCSALVQDSRYENVYDAINSSDCLDDFIAKLTEGTNAHTTHTDQ